MPPKPPLRVFVLDDNDDFRAALVGLLGDLEAVLVVGEGRSGEEAALLAKEHSADLAIVDLKMPVTGWAAIEAVRRSRPATRLVVVTAAPEEDRDRALRAGVDAVVWKAAPNLQAQMAEALERVTGRTALG